MQWLASISVRRPVFATVITLFLIPILYSRVAKGTVSPQTVSRRLDSSLSADAGLD